jgi:hypothetical protein
LSAPRGEIAEAIAHIFTRSSIFLGCKKTMSSLISIEEIKHDRDELNRDNFRAYYVVSTATTTVEQQPADGGQPSVEIEKIVEYILDKKSENSETTVDIVVQIHGYNTGDGYREDYRKASQELADIQRIETSDDKVVIFLGYAWPSENISFLTPGFLGNTLKALPLWLNALSAFGIVWILLKILPWELDQQIDQFFGSLLTHGKDWLISIKLQNAVDLFDFTGNLLGILARSILWLAALFPVPTLVLIMLRASVYFRDSYRATNYGVPDLVQFFRSFEYLLIKKWNSESHFKGKDKIRLSFIGHSMGGFVTTSVVRVLSDVFDSIDPTASRKAPAKESSQDEALAVIDGERIVSDRENKRSCIGRCFYLERLLLVSPDIPLNTILSGRSNFLSSSLSRFQESYLFSNEGDMVLLLFSTVANYISFPSTTSLMGYKLGNLGVSKDADARDIERKYKVDNFSYIKNKQQSNHTGNVLNSLIIGIDHQDLSMIDIGDDVPFVAQEFTYFDCTDYLRHKLSRPNEKIIKYQPLSIYRPWEYGKLLLNFSKTHGGYFDYPETRKALYTISCKGYNGFRISDTGRDILDGIHGIKVLKADDFPYKKPKQNP